ncbi:hypothetical protein [Pseudomonas fluorescens]|uniref:hypothetical protein n=1 Tax=Pseudomonas fluorescens TaxID=294 RepID=UPI001256ED7C|nr:hypothetical protein [Pseudomonas fluorescens]VVN80768.1 hypothetical protein PS720_01081 [Pseudomonas fluorescens]
MKWIALIVAVLIVVGIVQGVLGKASKPGARDTANSPHGKQDRLTESQILCLTSASKSEPIYAENPSHVHSQMPGGAACFNLRTVESLVKRGFLVSDQRGGYLLTDDGMVGLRRGMGYRD